jgi:hypothetical protein
MGTGDRLCPQTSNHGSTDGGDTGSAEGPEHTRAGVQSAGSGRVRPGGDGIHGASVPLPRPEFGDAPKGSSQKARRSVG